MQQIDLKSEHINLIKIILNHHLPPHAQIWIFGSRAMGHAKKYSDIDLLIDTGEPLSLTQIAILQNAFEESTLPYKVDLIDATTMSNVFRNHIQSQLILL